MTSPMTYEQAFAQLEEIVARLNSGTLTLDETVALYTRGRQLSNYCRQLLDAAELKITQLDGFDDYEDDDEDVPPPPSLSSNRPMEDIPF